MIRVYLFFIFIFISHTLSIGQNQYSDSLIDQLPLKTSDTAKTNLLNKICVELLGSDNKSALEYGNLAVELSEKIGYQKGLSQALYNLGSVWKDNGDNNKSLELYFKSLDIRQKSNNKKDIAATLINIGLVYREINNYNKSLDYFNQALSISEQAKDLNESANALNGLGGVYWKNKNYDQALVFYIRSLDVREKLGVKKDIAASLNNLGMVNKDYSNFILALDYYNKSLKISKKINDRKSAANTLNLIGSIFKEQKMYSEAIEHYVESLKMREEAGNKKDIAASLNNIGDVFKNINYYKKALEYYEKALKIRKEIGDQNTIAYTLNDIGSIYWKIKKFDKALQFYQEALSIRRGLGDNLGIANSLKNIGIIHKELKKYDLALETYEKALNIYKESGDKKNYASVLSYIGNVYNEQTNYPKALNYYLQSFASSEDANYKEGLASSALNIGDLYNKTDKKNEAITYYDKAISYAKEINQKDVLAKIYNTIDDLYADLSDYKKAWNYHKLFSEIRDDLMADEGSKKIAEVQVKYLTYKQDKELHEKKLELLKKQAELGKEIIIRNFMIAGLFVVLLILFLLYNQYQLKKKSNKLLSEQKNEIEKQAQLLEKTNHQLQIKNTQITDSISYAKLIQDAILPSANRIRHYLPDSFIYFRPRDIVSGDFYWMYQEGKKTFFAVVDCTGHGVPGGFMSMIGYTLLNDIVKEKKIFDLPQILEKLNVGIMHALNQNESKQDDGMDLSICCIDRESKKLHLALANQSALLIQKEEMTKVKGDIYSIGGIFSTRKKIEFTQQIFDLDHETFIYMFSDGFVDQIHNKTCAKYSTSRIEQHFFDNHKFAMDIQKENLATEFEQWKGNRRQIDDVLVVGIKINCL